MEALTPMNWPILKKNKKTDIQHTGSFPKSIPISRKLISSKSILWLPNLKELYISEADSLEVAFDLEGLEVDNVHQRISVLAQLKILMIKLLPKLTYVWKNVPRGIQGFQNLTSIEVYACHDLRYLFPPFVAKLLVELQSIEIQQCNTIKTLFKAMERKRQQISSCTRKFLDTTKSAKSCDYPYWSLFFWMAIH